MYSCLVQRQELPSAVNWEFGHLSQRQSRQAAAYVETVSSFRDAVAIICLFLYWNILFWLSEQKSDCLGLKSGEHVTAQCSVILRLEVEDIAIWCIENRRFWYLSKKSLANLWKRCDLFPLFHYRDL